FSTYSGTCISNEIRMFLRKQRKWWRELSNADTIVIAYDDDGGELYLTDTLPFSYEPELGDKIYEKEAFETINQFLERLPDTTRGKIIKVWLTNAIKGKRMTHCEIGEAAGASQ